MNRNYLGMQKYATTKDKLHNQELDKQQQVQNKELLGTNQIHKVVSLLAFVEHFLLKVCVFIKRSLQ